MSCKNVMVFKTENQYSGPSKMSKMNTLADWVSVVDRLKIIEMKNSGVETKVITDEFKITEDTLQDIMKNEDKYKLLKESYLVPFSKMKKMISIAPGYKELEQHLLTWLSDFRSQGLGLDSLTFQKKAMDLYDKMGLTFPFRASCKWVRFFEKCHNVEVTFGARENNMAEGTLFRDQTDSDILNNRVQEIDEEKLEAIVSRQESIINKEIEELDELEIGEEVEIGGEVEIREEVKLERGVEVGRELAVNQSNLSGTLQNFTTEIFTGSIVILTICQNTPIFYQATEEENKREEEEEPCEESEELKNKGIEEEASNNQSDLLDLSENFTEEIDTEESIFPSISQQDFLINLGIEKKRGETEGKIKIEKNEENLKDRKDEEENFSGNLLNFLDNPEISTEEIDIDKMIIPSTYLQTLINQVIEDKEEVVGEEGEELGGREVEKGCLIDEWNLSNTSENSAKEMNNEKLIFPSTSQQVSMINPKIEGIYNEEEEEKGDEDKEEEFLSDASNRTNIAKNSTVEVNQEKLMSSSTSQQVSVIHKKSEDADAVPDSHKYFDNGEENKIPSKVSVLSTEKKKILKINVTKMKSTGMEKRTIMEEFDITDRMKKLSIKNQEEDKTAVSNYSETTKVNKWAYTNSLLKKLEENMLAWLIDARSKGILVNGKKFRNKALQFHQELGMKYYFRASYYWINAFEKRYKIKIIKKKRKSNDRAYRPLKTRPHLLRISKKRIENMMKNQLMLPSARQNASVLHQEEQVETEENDEFVGNLSNPCEEFEQRLLIWLSGVQNQKQSRNGLIFKRKAMEIYEELGGKFPFKPTYDWVSSFEKRHNVEIIKRNKVSENDLMKFYLSRNQFNFRSSSKNSAVSKRTFKGIGNTDEIREEYDENEENGGEIVEKYVDDSKKEEYMYAENGEEENDTEEEYAADREEEINAEKEYVDDGEEETGAEEECVDDGEEEIDAEVECLEDGEEEKNYVETSETEEESVDGGEEEKHQQGQRDNEKNQGIKEAKDNDGRLSSNLSISETQEKEGEENGYQEEDEEENAWAHDGYSSISHGEDLNGNILPNTSANSVMNETKNKEETLSRQQIKQKEKRTKHVTFAINNEPSDARQPTVSSSTHSSFLLSLEKFNGIEDYLTILKYQLIFSECKKMIEKEEIAIFFKQQQIEELKHALNILIKTITSEEELLNQLLMDETWTPFGRMLCAEDIAWVSKDRILCTFCYEDTEDEYDNYCRSAIDHKLTPNKKLKSRICGKCSKSTLDFRPAAKCTECIIPFWRSKPYFRLLFK